MKMLFQILLILMILITFIGVIGESNNKELRVQLTSICVAAIITMGILLYL